MGTEQNQEQLKINLLTLGGNRIKENDLKGAADAYEKLLEIDPNDPHTWEVYSRILLALGQMAKSQQASNRSTELARNVVYEGDHCLFCNKDFSQFTTHARAKHPEFYQLQLKYEMEVYRKRQQTIEELDPSVKQIPPGMVIKGGVGVSKQVGPTSDQSIRATMAPPEGKIIEIDFFEYSDSERWEHLQFLQTARAFLSQAPESFFYGQEINRRQLEVIYQTSLKNKKRMGMFFTPRREALAAMRDHCGELMEQWRNRLESHEKEQATLASGGFTCPTCAVAFKSKSALSTHIRKSHPEEYEKQIEVQERASPMNARSKEWQDYMIARRKFEMFLSQDRISEAVEQLRIEVSKFLEDYDNIMAVKTIKNLDTGEETSMKESTQRIAKDPRFAKMAKQIENQEAANRRLSYQFLIDQARVLFQKHYKGQEIPQEIQDVLNFL